jgi:hypothetical protein
VGLVSVVLAVILLAAYVDRHRHPTVHTENVSTLVLVATQFIPKGTRGALIATQPMYAPMTLPPKEIEDGAVADPWYLSGRVSVVDILPGQQLTATNFVKDIRRG